MLIYVYNVGSTEYSRASGSGFVLRVAALVAAALSLPGISKGWLPKRGPALPRPRGASQRKAGHGRAMILPLKNWDTYMAWV